MRLATLSLLSMLLAGAAQAQPQAQPQAQAGAARLSGPVQQRIAPGLAAYTDEVLFGQVWPGAGLSPRDRSLVVISVLIATGKPEQLRGHLGRALDNGVTPVEASGVLTHLALYSGWPNAVTALAVFDEVYAARKVDLARLQAPVPRLPAPADEAARAADAARLGALAPRYAQLTQAVVEGDLWRRSDLSVRDRSLATIAALAAMGEAAQLPGYLRRGQAAGLTRAEVGEALSHLAFYAGWPRATAALEVAAATLGTATATAPASGAAAGNFTGEVSVGERFRGDGGSRLGGAPVTFAAGARTRWHSHPLGQLLIVTEGRGWTQVEGQPVRALAPGDIVWTPPGAKHWHGGTRTSGMTHVAVSEEAEGRAVAWLDPVTETQFQGP
jgi:4-carboxymuconolactone decarboxylase